ncbi:MAG: CcmD family protein [Firmicutes bacterium]|jgi:CcmD family protein|nr:CcmD family protein [Bacillota bacterium]
MVYFVIGYSIVWLMLLGYTAYVHFQQKKLERQLEVLEELAAGGPKAR